MNRFSQLVLIIFVSFFQNLLIAQSSHLAEVLKSSDFVISGRVIGKSCYIDSITESIFTRIELVSEQTFKGQGKNRIFFSLPGGVINGRVELHSHSPKLIDLEAGLFFFKWSKSNSDSISLITHIRHIEGQEFEAYWPDFDIKYERWKELTALVTSDDDLKPQAISLPFLNETEFCIKVQNPALVIGEKKWSSTFMPKLLRAQSSLRACNSAFIILSLHWVNMQYQRAKFQSNLK